MADSTMVLATSPQQVERARELFREYASGLGVDLEFQDFEQEVAALPGEYVAPAGCLLLALEGDQPIGCVAVRPLEPGICEMKRLYLRPTARGRGLGRKLAQAAMQFGRQAGYAAMRLDTLPTMVEARAMYRSLGFREISAYRFNPIPGTAFMELTLDPQA